jgi:Sulfotransferase family
MESSADRSLSHSSTQLRIFEAILDCWARVRPHDRRFNAEQLVDLVARRVRLSNFDDLEFLPDLQSLLEAFQTAPLTHIGRHGFYDMVQLALVRRLWLQHELRRNPDIRAESIRAPFIIIGFPRSGTTLLQNLLRTSPGCRWLRAWEIEPPFPETESWGTSKDARRRKYERRIAIVRRKNPSIHQLHPIDSPEECWRLLWPSFHCHTIFLFFGFHCYQQWKDIAAADASQQAYALHRMQLQFLQQRSSGTYWVLKAPEHLIHLPALLKIYPDARIIHLHREPSHVIASLCNLAAAIQPVMVRNLSSRLLGEQITKLLGSWSNRIFSTRSSLSEDRICDINYSNLIADPISTVRHIHTYFKTPICPEFLDRLAIQSGPRASSGHRSVGHDFARFGLNTNEINRLFEPYRKRFLG